MSAENFFHLEGNLAADPEAVGRSATTVVRFRMAVNSYDSSTKMRVGKFYRLTCFGKTAEFVLKYFAKGSGISVMGELDINEWVDKAAQKRNDVSLIAREVSFPPKSGGATGAGHAPSPGATPFEDEDEDDPFKLA